MLFIFLRGELNMCKENCSTCIEDKSCCNGVYRPIFNLCDKCVNEYDCNHRDCSEDCEDYYSVDQL